MMTPSTQGQITLVFCNIRKGEHVEAACEWIREQTPHVVLWQETQARDLLHVQARLEMHGYPAARTSASGNDNVIFLRDDGPFAVTQKHRHPWAGWHAPANVSVRMRNTDGQLSPRSLSLTSEHSCYWSADRRMDEANWYTTLAKDGWLAIAAGDWNGYAQNEGPTEDGSRRTDDRGDRILTAAGFVDAARWAAEHLGLSDALKPTAGYGKEKARQGGASRIDRAYLSEALGPAIETFRIADTERTRRMSDHLPGVLTLHRHILAELLNSTSATGNQGSPDGPKHPHGVPTLHRDETS
ncbi:endonuclease/exonuclease/phosphatase family protein [Streptomyces sp. NPDC057302]|uniref:endonuclease/exonuclease/phosphatase family protein n=1 Tax=Streptomyces sp. NPDC057302 TaxID=3346094 RepID=UPI00363D87E0